MKITIRSYPTPIFIRSVCKRIQEAYSLPAADILYSRIPAFFARALFSRSVFGQGARSFCFPGAFSTDARVRFVLPACFLAMRERALLFRSVFGLLASAHCFPRSFLGFSRVRTASCRKAELCFVAARCAAYGFPARKLSGFARGRAGKNTFNSVRTKINIQ